MKTVIPEELLTRFEQFGERQALTLRLEIAEHCAELGVLSLEKPITPEQLAAVKAWAIGWARSWGLSSEQVTQWFDHAYSVSLQYRRPREVIS